MTVRLEGTRRRSGLEYLSYLKLRRMNFVVVLLISLSVSLDFSAEPAKARGNVRRKNRRRRRSYFLSASSIKRQIQLAVINNTRLRLWLRAW